VAKVSNSFSMDMPPERAQAMFLRDIAPELGRDGSFFLYEDEPGLLAFSDGVIDAPEGFEEDEDVPEEPAADAGIPEGTGEGVIGLRRGGFPVEGSELSLGGGKAPAVLRREPRLYGRLRRLFARRVKVRFAAQQAGTSVTISGSAHRLVARGLNNLGQQGHWPEIATGSGGED
jgi:hypothetical protein